MYIYIYIEIYINTLLNFNKNNPIFKNKQKIDETFHPRRYTDG